MDSDNNYREKHKHSYQANHSIVENQLSSKNILEDAFNKAQAYQLLRKVLLDIIKRRKIIEDQIKIIEYVLNYTGKFHPLSLITFI